MLELHKKQWPLHLVVQAAEVATAGGYKSCQFDAFETPCVDIKMAAYGITFINISWNIWDVVTK